MNTYRTVQPHGEINEVFHDLYMVTGTNHIHHDGVDIQVSRNMVIVRDDHQLTLINTVRLNEPGLQALDALGTVQNVVNIGAFHGYDDAFYLDHYHAKLWALKNKQHQNNRQADYLLNENGPMPLPDCTLFNFETTQFPECMLILKRNEGNVLITCDCIQNWETPDTFFSEQSAKQFQEQGLIKQANIPDTWLGACQPDVAELSKIKALSFKHLISAHGVPLKDNAYEKVCETLKNKFSIS
ncbi:MAG: hypothetical protein AB7I18_01725 [Candidatus Berkiella sp.]